MKHDRHRKRRIRRAKPSYTVAFTFGASAVVDEFRDYGVKLDFFPFARAVEVRGVQ